MKKFSEDEVFTLISDVSGVSREDLKSSSRKDNIVMARKIFANAAKSLYPYLSLSRIGSYINRSHCSVIYYVKDHESLMMYNKQYNIMYVDVVMSINPEYVDQFENMDKHELRVLMDWHKNNYLKIKNLIE